MKKLSLRLAAPSILSSAATGIKALHRNKLRFSLILVFGTLLFGGTMHAQWVPTNLSGSINTVFSNGSVLLAGMNGGSAVIITTDDGVHWSGSDAGMTQYSDVRAFASNPTYIFAGTTNGVYRSGNTGTYNWTKVIDSVSCFSLLVNGSDIFAGTMGGGVYFSGDNGNSWAQVNTGLTMPYVYALASNSQYLFAGTYHIGTTNGAGVFRSSDNGQTWSQVSNGLTNNNIMSLAVKGGYLFAGTNGGGIFRSSDNGDNWTNVAGGVVHTLKASCDSVIYAGLLSSGGILRSTDNGTIWTAYNTGLPTTGGLTVMSLTLSSTNLFAGTLGGGVARAPSECTPPIQGEGCISWDLVSSDSVTSVSGNIHGQTSTIGAGTSSPFMAMYGYSNGQQLWVGNTGWVAGPLDPARFVEFNASPNSGNSFTVTNVSFTYGDFPLTVDFGIINFQAYYSTDHWSTSTVLNSTALVYLNTAMQSFNQSINVPVPSGQTFSLRIYPFALQNGIAMTPTFATHNNVNICGTTTPEISGPGSIGGMKFNDLNGNGVKDMNESGLPNWQINIFGAADSSVVTDGKGEFCFTGLKPGEYTIGEEPQSGWIQTTPSSPGTYTVTLGSAENIDSLFFGNKYDSCLNGTKAWSPLGTGINNGTNGEVWALAVIGSDLYAGGAFTTAGGSTVNHIAKWDGTSWSPLISSNGVNGINGTVTALSVIGTDLYVGGWFTIAGGVPAENIARWDGTNWSALGSGLQAAGAINALTVMGTDLFATSYILTPGLGGPGNLIVKWDGANWSTFSVMDDYVSSFLVNGSDLYAGGQFTLAGGVPANRIAKWDGVNWSPLGSGTDFYIGGSGLIMKAGNLYAGGRFITAGGNSANFIAQWNGSAWSSFGTGISNGMNNDVEGFALIGQDLYVSGSFTTAEGVNANSVAKWDGTNWTPLGAGMNDGVWRLAVIGTDLYAGGIFTTAGGMSANYIARYSCDNITAIENAKTGSTRPERFQLEQNYPNPFNPSTSIKYSLERSGYVSLKIYNVLGLEVAALVSEEKPVGTYEATWVAANVSSGIYFYRLESGSFSQTKKLILLK